MFAILIAFASYRLWALIALDEITRKARVWIFKEVRAEKKIVYWLHLWLKCPWCAGTWMTALITVITDKAITGGIGAPVLVFGAAAAGTALLGGNDDRLMESDDETD
jgi:hypothetical protein